MLHVSALVLDRVIITVECCSTIAHTPIINKTFLIIACVFDCKLCVDVTAETMIRSEFFTFSQHLTIRVRRHKLTQTNYVTSIVETGKGLHSMLFIRFSKLN